MQKVRHLRPGACQNLQAAERAQAEQGHWNKLAAGKALETIALPASSAKDDQAVTISRTPPEDDLDPKTREQLDEVRSRLAPVRITQRLAKPHPIIAGWIAICREEAERLRIAEQQRQYELKQQQKLERNRFRRFIEHADHWREAQLAREFVAAIRATIKDPETVIEGRPAHEWLTWADDYAAQLDPLSNPSRIFQSVAQVRNWTYQD